MTSTGAADLTSGMGLVPDAELTKVLDIAANVGDASKGVVSYTSLLIGLLWSDDLTSTWWQQQMKPLGARVDEIFRHRLVSERERAGILERVRTGAPYSPRNDPLSISARTVLREAQSVAQETGRSPSDPVGTRHLAAVYLFRNPPGHNRQFHQEWRFEQDVWRRAFAEFIATEYASEIDDWASVLGEYRETEGVVEPVSGHTLGNYLFDSAALGVMRSLEARAAPRQGSEADSSTGFTSERLLAVLASARSVPDCLSFAELVADRLGVTEPITLPAETLTYGQSATSLPISRGFKTILDRSRNLTRSTTESEEIGVRHIIASLLVVADSTANRRLVEKGVSLPVVRQRLFREFTRRWVNDDGVQWRFHFVGIAPPAVSGYSADEAETGDDRLDVARYATAFAVVMAADTITPPLSIGVFGDWGSGKSFFMRLMREETDRLSLLSTTDRSGKRLFCRRVASIRFNAWHYADRDLWASLVQTIFLGLRTAMVGDSGESDLMDAIIARLEVTKAGRKQAEKAVEQAVKRHEDAKAALVAAEAQAEEKRKQITAVASKDVVAAFRKTVLTDVRLRSAVQFAETYLGIRGVEKFASDQQKTAGEVIDFLDESAVVAGKTRTTWDWLSRAPVSRREIGALIGVTLAVIIVSGYLGIRYRDQISAQWATMSAVFIELGAVIGLVTSWARRQLSTVNRGLDEFAQVRAQIDGKFAEARKQVQKEVDDAARQRDDAQQSLEDAEARLKAADEEVRKAELELAESRSVQRIARLVEQRLTGKQYEQYLGIVDAIRKDFQNITDLMKKMRVERAESDPETPLDRIVLYIDDLDRCPADKVVAVLEAIHLLLAFELFVVVVGVDVRWAARSLADRYPRHLAAGVYESREGAAGAATAQDGASALDYLEKIFQIPFWLPPMDETASRNMIADLVPRVRAEDGEVRKSAESEAEQPPDGEDAERDARVEEPLPAAPARIEAAEPESLVIEAEERSFMLSLAGAVGKSPRRLKRFVNTYRILKASIDALQRETFIIERGKRGEYRAAMTLLALVTGAPRSALRVLHFLGQQKDDSAFDELITAVGGLADADEAPYMDAALSAYRSMSGDSGVTLRDLRLWTTQVARFSFRSGA